jgi:chemotaxis protein MotB
MAKHKHHGGAWKVAYADFITAMMALFLVLWLTAQDTKIKEAVERAFKNPFSSLTKEGLGIVPSKDTQVSSKKEGKFDSPSATELELLRRIAEDLARLLQQNQEDQNSIKLDLTPDGLRIQVFDRSLRPVFEKDSVRFTSYGTWIFSTLAWEIARFSTFQIELDGHTEAGQKDLRPEYGLWELSADRANATRRKLIENGIGAGQVSKVAGLGDTQPLPGTSPESEVNRRITVFLKVKPNPPPTAS